jgi:phenylacetate-CoA ligase
MTIRGALQRLATPLKRTEMGDAWIRRHPLHYRAACGLFARLSAASLEERRSWTARRLERVLRHAMRTAIGRSLGAGTNIEEWPLLDQRAVSRAPDDHMAGVLWSVPASTGGTTGVPLALHRSLRSVAYEQAAIDHVLRNVGVDPARARVAVLRGDDIKSPDDRDPPYWIRTTGGKRMVFSSNHLNRDTYDAFATALSDVNADYWWVYPTTLGALSRLAESRLSTLRVPLIVSSSEVLDGWTRSAAARLFGARILDYYGQAERVAFAWSESAGAYHFLPGYAHVELLQAGMEDGMPIYEIVGTSLWNEAMPLVRYRTGDLIRVRRPWTDAEREAVALGIAPFDGVLGRNHEFLVAPDGTHLTGMDHLHRGVSNVARVQIHHVRPDRVEIHAIPASGYGTRDREHLLANARLKIPAAIEVVIVETERLHRTRAGKTPFIVRAPGVPVPPRPEAIV